MRKRRTEQTDWKGLLVQDGWVGACRFILSHFWSNKKLSQSKYLSSPCAKRAGPGCYWQTVPPQWGGVRLFDRSTGFFYENCCNSGTESLKIVPKVGNERSLQGLQTGCWPILGHMAKFGYLGPKVKFWYSDRDFCQWGSPWRDRSFPTLGTIFRLSVPELQLFP